jgi:hypothetical protein
MLLAVAFGVSSQAPPVDFAPLRSIAKSFRIACAPGTRALSKEVKISAISLAYSVFDLFHELLTLGFALDILFNIMLMTCALAGLLRDYLK